MSYGMIFTKLYQFHGKKGVKILYTWHWPYEDVCIMGEYSYGGGSINMRIYTYEGESIESVTCGGSIHLRACMHYGEAHILGEIQQIVNP